MAPKGTVAPSSSHVFVFKLFSALLLKHVMPMRAIHSLALEKEAQSLDKEQQIFFFSDDHC